MEMLLEQFKTIFDRPEKVKRLRETILDFAVNGKLVTQNSDDEPASTLLERIKEEKEKLIKDGKIKNEKNLPDTQEDVRNIKLHDGWTLCRLGDIVTYKNGYAFSSKHMDSNKEGIPVIKSNTIMQKQVIFNYKTDYVSTVEKKMEECYVKQGDLLMCLSSQSANVEPLGVTALYEYEDYALLNQRVLKMTPIGEMKDTAKFILHSINSREFHERLSIKGTGSAQSNLKLQHVLEMIFKLPPLEEQKRIVEKIDLLMNFCDKLEEVLDKKIKYGNLSAKSIFNAVGCVSNVEELEETIRFILSNFKDLSLGDNAVKELKSCILQLAVQGKLVPQNPSESAEILVKKIMEEKEILIKDKKIKKEKPLREIEGIKSFIIPSGWSLVRLGNLAKVIEYGTSTKADLDDNKVPVLRMNNIIDGKLDYSNLKYVDSDIKDLPRLYLNNNDILFNRTNSYELVGKTAVFKGLDNTMTFASYLIRVALFNDRLNAEYINIVMNSNIYRVSQIEPEITQQNGQANFNGTKLKSTIIPLPPLEEQNRIVEKVESLLNLCDKLDKEIQVYNKYRLNLMESIVKNIV